VKRSKQRRIPLKSGSEHVKDIRKGGRHKDLSVPALRKEAKMEPRQDIQTGVYPTSANGVAYTLAGFAA